MYRSVIAFVAFTAIVGCATDITEDAESDVTITAPPTEVARAVTADGTIYRFLEADPGSLFVWATFGSTTRVAASPDASLTYVELYRRLTSQPAPQALVDAQARAYALPDDPNDDDSGMRNEAGGEAKPTGTIAAISASDFQDDYCFVVGWDYSYCWPSFYGSPFVQRKVSYMQGYVAAVYNTITFRFRYKQHSYSSWTTLVSSQALPGQVHMAFKDNGTHRRWCRFEVLDNGGNLVRYSNFGLDD